MSEQQPPQITADRVAELLCGCAWTFTKTMPNNLHCYTVRKNWNDAEFCAVVLYIREHGYIERFGSKDYIMLNVGEYKYWTMGSPMWDTCLINRKFIYQDKLNQKVQRD